MTPTLLIEALIASFSVRLSSSHFMPPAGRLRALPALRMVPK